MATRRNVDPITDDLELITICDACGEEGHDAPAVMHNADGELIVRPPRGAALSTIRAWDKARAEAREREAHGEPLRRPGPVLEDWYIGSQPDPRDRRLIKVSASQSPLIELVIKSGHDADIYDHVTRTVITVRRADCGLGCRCALELVWSEELGDRDGPTPLADELMPTAHAYRPTRSGKCDTCGRARRVPSHELA